MSDVEEPERDATRSSRRAYVMAVVFGVLSVPWTFGFEQVAGLPLWPSFIASASFFAAGGGPRGLGRSLAGNVVGAAYGAATLWIEASLGAGAVGLSMTVGAFMLLASLHALVPGLSFTPAAFFGYAVLFSVHAAGVTLGAAGLSGKLVAAAASMVIGALIGLIAEQLTQLSTPTASGAPR